jgi:hypothetical protein
MSLEKAFLIGLAFLIGAVVVLQIYLFYRIRKHRQKIRVDPSNIAEPRLSSKASFRFGLFHTIFYSYIIISSLYYTWIGKFSVFLGFVIIIVGLVSIRRPLKLVRDHHPVRADLSVALPLQPRSTHVVTPELIMEMLGEESVIEAIRKDLQKIGQIGRKEQWRLGLLTPDMDTYDLSYNRLSRKERLAKVFDYATMINMAEKIPIKRAAILHNTIDFNIHFNRILLFNGTREPMIRGYPGRTYALRSKIPANGYMNIRDIEINTDSPYARNRNQVLLKFLQEDGFPLKDSYTDGDPLTSERGGTIVIDQGKIKIIYPDYYIQSRLIDDEGNLVYMGLDENFKPSSTWNGISVKPSISMKLYKCVNYNEYAPILRYRSFPYASDFMLPILDTPMSESGWADLFIDTRGKAKLFIAKQKTLKEWLEMMEKLHQLFFGELTKKGYHLLGLTKDRMHLNEYFSEKQKILEDYFTVVDWSLV